MFWLGECEHGPRWPLGEGEAAEEVGKGALDHRFVGLGLWLTWSGEGISV